MAASIADQVPDLDQMESPPLLLLISETRAYLEMIAFVASLPLLINAPRGDGHPVLVLPGLMADDSSTLALRGYLNFLGYQCFPWNLGRNKSAIAQTRTELRKRLAEIYHHTGQKVSLVGWSLGGVYARDLALSCPDQVRSVLSLGSPFAGGQKSSNVRWVFEWMTGETAQPLTDEERTALRGDLPVPTTAFFTRTDGVVNWRSCLLRPNDRAENIAVIASHNGLGFNPAVLWAIADRLSQADGTFAPFQKSGPFQLMYE